MYSNVNDMNLYYEKSGNGEPLILLHGNGEDHHIFDEISNPLKDQFTVYAIDSRNHGQSTKTGVYSYEIMAEDVYSFVQSLRLGRIHVIGFSDGAIISLLLAMKHPEVIEKMALLGVNLKPDDFTEENYRFVKETYEETKDPLYKLMLEQPNIALEEVRSVDVPTLVIAGENDIYKPELFEELSAALPNARLKIMQDHNHDSYIVHNDILYRELIDFFSR